MSVADVVVVVASAAALAGLGWFFFAPRRARTARREEEPAKPHQGNSRSGNNDNVSSAHGEPLSPVFRHAATIYPPGVRP